MDTKNWWASKTVWASILTMLIALCSFLVSKEVLDIVPDAYDAMWTQAVLFVVGIVNLVLRLNTSSAIK